MIKANCFVRHLDASETMGQATCICTDKTGTLTENKMTVVKVLVEEELFHGAGSGEADSKEFNETMFNKLIKDLVMESVCINSDCFLKINPENGQDMFIGSATEGALLVFARKLGVSYDQIRKSVSKVEGGTWLFSSDRKRMSTLVIPQAILPSIETRKYRLYTKGASEIVLDLCTHYLKRDGSEVEELYSGTKAKIKKIIEKWASEGLRTLGIAYRDTDQLMTTLESNDGKKDDPEHDLVWIGLFGVKDPLRSEVPEAVATCQRAGMTIRMVTGDNVLTARKIARECGILYGDGIALEGPVFRSMSIQEKIAIVPKLQVLARSSPSDKFELVHLLKELGEVVAVTGDGTNDAPALKEADVGFAMGISGTQIARNASDIILLDDNFVSLVQSVRWGRNVLNAVRKFLQFQLAINLVAITLTFIGAVSSGESPLTVVQLLLVNLVMDSFGALGLASDEPEDDILDHPPHARNASLLSTEMKQYMFIQVFYQIIFLISLLEASDLMIVPDTVFHTASDLSGTPSLRTKTLIFTTFILLQLANLIMARQLNGEINVFKGIFRNKIFIVIFFVTGGIVVLGITVGGAFFGTCELTGLEWAYCILIAIGNIFFTILSRGLIQVYNYYKPKPLVPVEQKIESNTTSTSTFYENPTAFFSSPDINIESPLAETTKENTVSHWGTVQSAVVLIGHERMVSKPDYIRKGPSEEFKATWFKFKKDRFVLPTKAKSQSMSLESLRSSKKSFDISKNSKI
jgi:P-type Ca2+ transporter type 2C